MTVDDETGLYSLLQGCPVHGDEDIRECSMCGVEFCGLCQQRAAVCENCAEQAEEEEEPESEPDFEDVANLEAVTGSDEEIERVIEDAERTPPPADLSHH